MVLRSKECQISSLGYKRIEPYVLGMVEVNIIERCDVGIYVHVGVTDGDNTVMQRKTRHGTNE